MAPIFIFLFFLVILLLLVYLYPEMVFWPANAVFALDSFPQKNFYPVSCFPLAGKLEAALPELREEGWKLFEQYRGIKNHLDYFPTADIDKRGWTTIPLRLFHSDSETFLKEAPVSREFLQHAEIVSFVFSIMEPQKIIETHYNPYQGLLRYQLPLEVPEGECYIEVNGEKWYWKNGESLIFDESLPHSAVNKTDKYRLVLLIDLVKPWARTTSRLVNAGVLSILQRLPQTRKATLI